MMGHSFCLALPTFQCVWVCCTDTCSGLVRRLPVALLGSCSDCPRLPLPIPTQPAPFTLALFRPCLLQLLLHDVPVRRGLLLLGPGNAVLLGGQVERTEAARQRAVAAWNKPVGRWPGRSLMA